MRVRLTTACIAIAAFAALATVPTSASATATIGETANGQFVRIAVGEHIKGTNVGNAKFITGVGNIECNNVVLTGKLEANGDAASEGTIETAAFAGAGALGKCVSPFFGDTQVTTNVGAGVPWCLKAVEVGMEATIRGNSCAKAARAITVVFDTPLGECKYERAAAIRGTFTTDAAPENSDAIVHIPQAGANFVGEAGNLFFCPVGGALEMSVTLETDQTSAVPLFFL